MDKCSVKFLVQSVSWLGCWYHVEEHIVDVIVVKMLVVW